MINIVVIAIVVLVLGSAIAYVIKEKKNGRKCIGCPNSGACSAKNRCGK